MPKGETGGVYEQEAWRCHDRALHAAAPLKEALDFEAADWLAFAVRDRARRVQAFRVGLAPARADTRRANAHQVLRAGRLAG